MFNSKTQSRKCKRQTPRYNPESRVRTISTMSTLKTTLRKPQPSCRWSAKPIFSESKPRNIHTLRLAKIPENIVNAVKAIISKWSTQLNLPTENSNIDAGEIRYNKGVLQGDFLSVVLFILSLNPGSFLINKTTGYKIGP